MGQIAFAKVRKKNNYSNFSATFSSFSFAPASLPAFLSAKWLNDVDTPHPSLKSLGMPLHRGNESQWGVGLTLHSPFTDPSLKSPWGIQGTQRKLTDSLLRAHRKPASCSSLVRRERTLSPQGADCQSDRHGLRVCFKWIASQSKVKGEGLVSKYC